jgi:predicted ATPase
MYDIPFAASESEARTMLDQHVHALLGDEAPEVVAFLAHMLLLPLSEEESDLVRLEPEVLQSRYVAAIHRSLRAVAAAGPIVLVFEDIHWADPASVDVALLLLPLAAALPVLTIFCGRSETDAPGWRLVTQMQAALGPGLTEIRLQPLNESESRELVANLLEIESLPDLVRDTILTRSEGNPFFVEEVIRMLIEHGAIVRHGERWTANETVSRVEIPDTLHGLLLARIDQLPEDAKRSLRVASVIGRQFPVRVLERVLAARS